MTTLNQKLHQDLSFLQKLIESSVPKTETESAQLNAAKETIDFLLFHFADLETQPLTTQEWEHIPPYLYISRTGARELRIPYRDITLTEAKLFSEAVLDADAELLIVKV